MNKILTATIIAVLATATAAIATPITTAAFAQAQTPAAPPANVSTTTAVNATATNTTTSNIVTTLVWNPGEEPDMTSGFAIGGERIEQLSPQNIQYQQTDPAFAKLAQVTRDCLNDYNAINDKIEAFQEQNAAALAQNPGLGTGYDAEDINRQDLCTDTINQGLMLMCDASDFANYDMMKCEEARTMSETYVRVAETLYG